MRYIFFIVIDRNVIGKNRIRIFVRIMFVYILVVYIYFIVKVKVIEVGIIYSFEGGGGKGVNFCDKILIYYFNLVYLVIF